jgi:hypothetical protein
MFEDVCENERHSARLTGRVKVNSENLAKYAGTYPFPGREVEVIRASRSIGSGLVADVHEIVLHSVIRG